MAETYEDWLKTAKVGDVFDWAKANPKDKTYTGVSSKVTGFTEKGGANTETIETPERRDWRGALQGAKTYEEAMNRLLDIGQTPEMARFLIAQEAGWDYVLKQDKKTAPTVVKTTKNSDGSSTVVYSNGTTKIIPAGSPVPTAAVTTDTGTAERKSAYDLLYQQFAQYGLGSLVEPLKSLILEGVSPSEFTIRLRETDAYKKRFAANQARINSGLRALSEAEYIGLEDQYQSVMRNYGLPASYYQRGDMGTQQGFEKFIAGDVSAAELEDRIQTAQNRVINAAPEVAASLREFYPDITNGDILAYALDPNQALSNIKRKVGAAEIGAGAAMAGLSTGLSRAEELQRYGVTGEAARAGFQTIGSLLPRATQLGDIYAKQGMGPFTQTTAEAEVFGTPGAVDAANKRKKLAQLEAAQFSGSAGITGGALGRERAGQF